MPEVWKDLKGYAGNYQVSNMGNVWSVKSNRLLKPAKDKDGYLKLTLTNPHGKKKYERVHRLVALMFCEKGPDTTVVNHLNMVKDDNRATNLEWCTVSHNTKHAYNNSEKIRKNTLRASRMGADKITKTIEVHKNGEYVGTFTGKERCAEELGISPKTVYNGLNNLYKNRLGYTFKEVGDASCT